MVRILSALVLSALLGCVSSPQGDARARALRLMAVTPLFDGHNDLPWRLRKGNALHFEKVDIRKRTKDGHTDIPRLRAGRVGAQFWSVYVPVDEKGDTAVRLTMEQIDVVHRMIDRFPDVFAYAKTSADVERIFASGRIASLIGMEGGHCINSSLGALRMFKRMGAHYMTLAHSSNTPWADSATDARQHAGLTELGRQVVSVMNNVGMLVDLSHVSVETMHQALDIVEAPVIFSHSSARAVTDHPRNVPDDVLRRLPKNGGVVMVTFVPRYISRRAGDWGVREHVYRLELQKKWGRGDPRIPNALRVWTVKNPEPTATLDDAVAHIEHVRKVAGIDHVGIGSDFDGISSVPVGLEDVSKFPDLIAALLERGFSDMEVRKLLGINLLRVMRGAEARATR
ncbi:MAG: membrane dipeptidase [Planctomycetes bacterium]|nr:membrane dipeptidase [Planctomycetota bacterium]MDP6423157.1 dipeptidase [Planctomycetota bacterium]